MHIVIIFLAHIHSRLGSIFTIHSLVVCVIANNRYPDTITTTTQNTQKITLNAKFIQNSDDEIFMMCPGKQTHYLHFTVIYSYNTIQWPKMRPMSVGMY